MGSKSGVRKNKKTNGEIDKERGRQRETERKREKGGMSKSENKRYV